MSKVQVSLSFFQPSSISTIASIATSSKFGERGRFIGGISSSGFHGDGHLGGHHVH
ncbi:hypothetical protein D3C71_2137200 [compost metagenome]